MTLEALVRVHKPAAVRKGLSDRWLRWLLLAPAASVMIVIMVYPLGYSFWLSLHSYGLIYPARFVGLLNYARILTDPNVWQSIRVTFAFAVPAFLLELSIGFGLALLIHYEVAGKALWRTLFLMPLLLTSVVIAINWRVMLNYDFGVVNYYLSLLGLPKQDWLNNASYALPALIVVDVWHTTPFVMMILAAGLSALPQEPFEMADIDGAAFFQRLWYLSIPLLRPLFLVIALFRSYELIRVFDIVFGLTYGGPGRATTTLSFDAFVRLIEGFQVGYSAAVSYVLFFISLIISITLISFMGTESVQESG